MQLSEYVVSENLFRKILCLKICFGKFGVGKSVSENSVSEYLLAAKSPENLITLYNKKASRKYFIGHDVEQFWLTIWNSLCQIYLITRTYIINNYAKNICYVIKSNLFHHKDIYKDFFVSIKANLLYCFSLQHQTGKIKSRQAHASRHNGRPAEGPPETHR